MDRNCSAVLSLWVLTCVYCLYSKSRAKIPRPDPAQVLAASVELNGNDIELEFEAEQMPEFQNAQHPTHYQLWDADGTVVAKSPLLGTHDLLCTEGPLNALVLVTSRDKNGRPERAAGLKFVPSIACCVLRIACWPARTTNDAPLWQGYAR